jgi:tetratricopeptide (TPR) repeat protein
MKRTIVFSALGLLALAAMAQSTRPSSGPRETTKPSPASATKTAAAPASAPQAPVTLPPPGPTLSPEQVLTVESLVHSAQSLVNSASTPSRAGRLVTLTRYAYALNAADPQAEALMSDIFEIQGDMKSAGDLALKRLEAQNDDYILGLSCLRLNVAAISKAKDRLAFLQGAGDNNSFTTYLRAEALAQAGDMLLRQNQNKSAKEKFQQAIQLDPKQARALAGLMGLAEKPTALDNVKIMLQLLESNPNDTDAAWSLALLLDSTGLYDKAMVFYNYGWQLAGRFNPDTPNEGMAINYFNGLLDAASAHKAIEIFVPLQKRLGDSPELKSLLIEAYRDAGSMEKVNQLMDALKIQMQDRESLAGKSSAAMRECAWYYLINDCYPNSAVAYARAAAKLSETDDPTMTLVVAAAELRAGDAAAGEAALKKLMNKDAYACWFLAQYYYENKKSDDGKKAVLAGAKLTRRGRAFRSLVALAKRQDVTIPAADGADAIDQAVQKFDARCLDMALSPEQFIAVKLAPTKEEYAPGDRMQLEATLTNNSNMDIPLGPLGLFNSAMSLQVNLDSGQEFLTLPMVVWPAHRYLKAGEILTTTVRLDVGDLEAFLVRHPLDTFKIKVSGTLDPVVKATGATSMLPTYRVPSVTFTRGDLLVDFDRQKGDWEKDYDLSLGYIVKDLKEGELRDRMAAARKIGSLLTLVAEVRAGRAELPKPLADKVKQPVLLSMLKFTLQDSSPLVRAEMIRSLDFCRVDGRVLALLKPLYDDKSEPVRVRLVELLGVAGQLEKKELADRFAADPGTWVKQMTAVFK